ncbi:hypothetical protein [Streptomyces sp. NPDC004267]|uniref:hypothetical protein n=1 Tax=Streptomyces sp. NPDC004267 TaxID=3364694 RepID=UPI00368C2018
MFLLLIRRPRRLRHLRRLAGTEPFTITHLPGSPRRAAAELPMPPTPGPDAVPIRPSQPDAAELDVKAWLHAHQHGRADTAFPADAEQR